MSVYTHAHICKKESEVFACLKALGERLHLDGTDFCYLNSVL